jgi:hypothetical protein
MTKPNNPELISLCIQVRAKCSGACCTKPCQEMEFLDIRLTKYSSLLLRPIHSPFYTGEFWRKPYSSLVMKALQKKIYASRKTRICLKISFCRTVNEGIEAQAKNGVWKYSSLCPETLTKNDVQEFQLRSLGLLALHQCQDYINKFEKSIDEQQDMSREKTTAFAS